MPQYRRRTSTKVNTHALASICSISLGFALFVIGVLILGVTIASKEDTSVTLRILGPICIASGVALCVAGQLYKVVFKRYVISFKLFGWLFVSFSVHLLQPLVH